MTTTIILAVVISFVVERVFRVIVTLILDYREDIAFKKAVKKHEEYKREHPNDVTELLRFARDRRRFIV